MTEQATEGNAQPQDAESGTAVTKDAQNMSMIAHLLGIVLGVIGPLIIYLVKKDDHPFIEAQSREALNFQITVLIAWFVAFVLTFVFIGILLIPVILIGNLVFCIIAALTVSKGEPYRYPIALRLLK